MELKEFIAEVEKEKSRKGGKVEVESRKVDEQHESQGQPENQSEMPSKIQPASDSSHFQPVSAVNLHIQPFYNFLPDFCPFKQGTRFCTHQGNSFTANYPRKRIGRVAKPCLYASTACPFLISGNKWQDEEKRKVKASDGFFRVPVGFRPLAAGLNELGWLDFCFEKPMKEGEWVTG